MHGHMPLPAKSIMGHGAHSNHAIALAPIICLVKLGRRSVTPDFVSLLRKATVCHINTVRKSGAEPEYMQGRFSCIAVGRETGFMTADTPNPQDIRNDRQNLVGKVKMKCSNWEIFIACGFTRLMP